jgi:hypothetical protein
MRDSGPPGRPLPRVALLALLALLGCKSTVDDCRGPGRYEAGKEGSYRPCCAGLTEVFYKKPAYVGGVPACAEFPLRVYACVRGTCGDGVCEAGEAPSCGCVADCRDAAWGPQDADAGPRD